MKDLAFISKLKEMRNYDKVRKDIHLTFNYFEHSEILKESDLKLLSYVLDIEEVPSQSPLELRLVQKYIKCLLLADKYNYNINMEFWAYWHLLTPKTREIYI